MYSQNDNYSEHLRVNTPFVGIVLFRMSARPQRYFVWVMFLRRSSSMTSAVVSQLSVELRQT